MLFALCVRGYIAVMSIDFERSSLIELAVY